MVKIIRKAIGRFIPRYVKAQIRNFYILAFEYGQFKTIKNWECVDKDGNPIPWYTYPAIEFLGSLDFSTKNVFEYGAGNSTLWWGQRALNVVSVEHNPEWFAKIQSKLLRNNYGNVKLILEPNKDKYIKSILQQDLQFDVVIIDGRWRGFCASVIGEKLNLKDGFMIVLDNSDWYPKTAEFIKEKYDAIRIDFHGFSPINSYTLTTSIFISRNVSFEFRNNFNFSVKAIKQIAEDDEIWV